MSNKNVVVRLEKFLDNLQRGQFADQMERAFEEFNLVVSKSKAARRYLLDEYLPAQYTNGRASQQQLTFIASGTLTYTVPSLAHVVSEALIKIYAKQHDEELLSTLLEIVSKYDFRDLVSVESGRNLRLEAARSSFSLHIPSIRLDTKLNLLQLALRKYVRLLVIDGPPSSYNLPSIIRRLNDIFTLLLNSNHKRELARRTALLPFTFDQIRYSPEQSRRLFGTELNVCEYEQRLFDLYRLPLFPLIEADKLEFVKNKISFRNEGEGSLPPATICLQVGENEFEVGELTQPVLPNEVCDLFVEEEHAFACFLLQNNPNVHVNVVFSYHKFGNSYDLGILTKPVGNWREQVPIVVMERAVLHQL